MSSARVGATLLGLTVLALAAACGGPATPPAPFVRPFVHQGPIVLVTLDALRADEVGALGGPPRLTPHLDALAAGASWSGRAVAPSSWTVPSMGTLFTGLQPWRLLAHDGDPAALPPSAVTLPEALQGLGVATAAFRSNVWLHERYGYARGFDEFRSLGEGKRAEAALTALSGARTFHWVHVLPPHAPYVRRDALRAQLPDQVPADLPAKVRPLDLEAWFDPDPGAQAPAAELARLRAMYRFNVAWADQVLGRLLAALRASGQWDRTLLVVTADHGEEFEEHGQSGHGGNLGRPLLEVPLVVKLPREWQGPPLAVPAGARPATARVRATLIEAAGGTAAEGTPPSLFREASNGVLSELYVGNGVNRFSWVEGDLQLLWESRFAPPEPDYYRSRLVSLGGTPPLPPPAPLEELTARLERAFATAPPLAGRADAPPVLSLWRWTPNGVEPVDDARRRRELAGRLRAAWTAANGPDRPRGTSRRPGRELTPEEEAEMRALGYAG